MLRLIFVFLIIGFGAGASLFSPFYALLFYLWNAYFRPEEWTYGGLIGSLNLSFIIGGYLVAATAVSLPKLRFNLLTLLLALFFADTLYCTLYSEHVAWSWGSWIVFSKVLIVAFIMVLLTTTRERYRLVLVTIALSLGFECAKQGWAQLFVAPGAQNNNTIAFLGDNNGVAVGTMMLVPVLAALANTATRRWEKYLHRFLLIGVFMRGITTYSRGGFIAAAVLGIFGLIRSPRKIRALIGTAVLAGLVTAIMPPQFWDRMNTINASEDERDDSAAGRLHFWKVAIMMAKTKPMTGVGFNGFSQSYEAYNGPKDFGDDEGEFSGERAAHSIWFATLGDLGYPGLVLFAAVIGLGLFSCWRVSVACKRDERRRDLYLYANALISSLAVFVVGGSFLSFQYNEMFWHFAALSATLPFLAQEEAHRVPVAVPAAPAMPQPAFGTALRTSVSK